MAECDTKPLKQSILQDSYIVQDGSPRICGIPLKEIVRDDDSGIEKLEYGHDIGNDLGKVIMMVGETGSGKTTLINGLVNYVFGVDWKDPFRFKMIVEASHANQAESQTKDITSYTLHHQDGFQMPYSLTIVDTPGFGDTKGVQRDKEIVEQIHKFFTNKGGLGITHIDAVGFVVQASQARLSVGQKYVFDSILSLFGKDIKDNIFLLVTFADGKEPEVLSAVSEAEIPYKDYFQFNNSALYSKTDGNRFGGLFWEMGCENFETFLKQVLSVESKSLFLTKEVLEERKSIEVFVAGIQREIKVQLSKQNTLKKERELLEKHEKDIDQNKNFEIEVEEDVFEVKYFGKSDNLFSWLNPFPTRSMRNCMKCKRTCCKDCVAAYMGLGGDWCYSMDKTGMCTVCPLHCSSAEHEICDFMHYVTRKKIHKTVDEIRRRYEDATGKKLSAQNLIAEIKADYDSGQQNILKMVISVRKSLERLREIALRPDPLKTVEYIDIMIENEKTTAKAGWQERVEELNQLKQMAEQIQQIEGGNFDPMQRFEPMDEGQ